MTKRLASTLIASAMLATASATNAADLTFAGGWPPNSPPTKAIEAFSEKVAEYSGGDLNIRVFPLSLLNFAESNAGVRDGIADLVTNLTPYFPSEFPNYNMLVELSQITSLEEFDGDLSMLGYLGALNEYAMLNCEACAEEFAAQNQLLLGGITTPPYGLQCVTPLTSVADLQGKRIRTAGAYWARWAEAIGATPVSMSANETLEGLSQGVLDCTASSPADVLYFGFVDAVKYVYSGLPGGLFIGSHTMNKDSWDSLTDDQKTALLRGHAYLSASLSWSYIEGGRIGAQRGEELGVEFGPASDALIEANREFISQDLASIPAVYNDRFGVANGEAALASMTESLRKWAKLTNGVTTQEELAEIYWREFYSKIDLSTYGK